MKRKIHIFFITIIAASLFFPGILTILKLYIGDIQKRSEAENRLLTIPLHVTSVRKLRKKCQRIEDLIEDQLSVRDEVRILYNRIMVFGFGHSSQRNIILGHDGYWFNVGHRKNHFFRFEATGKSIPKYKTDQIANAYRNFDRYMTDKNVFSAVMFVPTKPYLFPDKLPGYFKKLLPDHKEKSITKLVGAMKRKGCRVYYPFQMASEIPEDLLYDRRTFHWHGAGAQILLYMQFSQNNPFEKLQVFPLPLNDLEIVNVKAAFDLGLLLGLGPLSFQKKTYLMPYNIVELEGSDFQELRKFMNSGFYLRTFESTNKNDLRALLVTDSFGWAANQYIPYHFQSTAFVNTNGFPLRSGIIQEMAEVFVPDAIIFLLNENHVSNPNMLMKLFSVKNKRN